MPDWLASGRRHVWPPYTQVKTAPPPLPVVAAEGLYLELADGRRLLDATASWWTVAHGYRHPHIEQAVKAQLERLPHVMMGGLAQEQAWRLATRLAGLLPGDLDHVFFSESGSVAVEVAMKIAAQYWLNRGRRRPGFLAFQGGYHGDTFATMGVCDPDEGMHAHFAGIVPAQPNLPLPLDDTAEAALDRLLGEIGPQTSAMLVEPLAQGAGGMRFHDAAVLHRLRRLCDRHDLLLIFDEIFTGFARTGGALFACQAAGVIPDIVTVGKALTGGTLPLAATIARTTIYDAFLSDDPAAALMHGPTYMGNALACAAANASLDLFAREPRIAQADAIAGWLRSGLAPAAGLPHVRDVRVKGAIGVVQLDRPVDVARATAAFVERGIWLRPLGDVLYTTPALITGEQDIARIAEAIVAIASDDQI
jgi:adenosylmethionine-8-amino-7-oxononanoate aminotransferase